MQILLYYFLAVCAVVPAVWWLTGRIARSPDAPLVLHLLRIELRCLIVAAAFSPTVIVAGYVGFPAPASLVLGHWLLSAHTAPTDGGIQNEIRWSTTSLVFCFVTCSALYLASFFCGVASRQPDRTLARMGASSKMVCGSLWGVALTIVALLALMCLLGPCSHQGGAITGP
jgi:hypothetical protein